PQAAHDEDEQVDGVRHQHQAGQHLEAARTQDQPDAGAEQHADGERNDNFHQRLPRLGRTTVSGAPACGRRLRTVWCASAMRISMVEPTTTKNTPRSNTKALGTCTSPSSGRCRCAVWLVRNGKPNASAPRPVAQAVNSAREIHRSGRRRMCSSSHAVPAIMCSTMTATEKIRPATKPPPGRLWPRMKK